MIVSPNDVGDAHLRVVDGNGEVVERGAVAPRDDEVVLGPIRERHRAPDQVVHDRLALVGDPQANRGARHGPRRAAVSEPRIRGLGGPHRAGRSRVGIGGAGLQQPLDRQAVVIAPLELRDRPLVPVELEPAQGVEDELDILGR